MFEYIAVHDVFANLPAGLASFPLSLWLHNLQFKYRQTGADLGWISFPPLFVLNNIAGGNNNCFLFLTEWRPLVPDRPFIMGQMGSFAPLFLPIGRPTVKYTRYLLCPHFLLLLCKNLLMVIPVRGTGNG